MKTVKSVLPKMAGFFLVMLIITSVIYPAVITAAANVAFGHEANGSVIVGKDGTKYGSALLAQEFTGNQYLWGRVMNVDTGTFTDENGEPLAYAGASNKTPAGSELEAMIACSGSGLDPEISPAAAGYQAERIARERNMAVEDVEAVISRYTTGRFLGMFGEPRVNVLKVNLALDGLI